MNRILFALLGFLAMVSSSLRADDIVVYRGSIRLNLDANASAVLPPLVQVYWVINYTTAETRYILYFNKAGKKQETTLSPVSIGTLPLPNSKQATVLAQGTASEPGTDFSYSLLVLRGTNVALPVETGSSPRTISRPRVLTGDLISVANGSSSYLVDGTVSVTLDKAQTVAANNEDKSVATVVAELEALLSSKGFQQAEEP